MKNDFVCWKNRCRYRANGPKFAIFVNNSNVIKLCQSIDLPFLLQRKAAETPAPQLAEMHKPEDYLLVQNFFSVSIPWKRTYFKRSGMHEPTDLFELQTVTCTYRFFTQPRVDPSTKYFWRVLFADFLLKELLHSLWTRPASSVGPRNESGKRHGGVARAVAAEVRVHRRPTELGGVAFTKMNRPFAECFCCFHL